MFQYRLEQLPALLARWEAHGLDVTEPLRNWSMLTTGRYWVKTEAGAVPRVHSNAWGTEAEIMEDRVVHFWDEFSEALPAILEPVPEPFATWLSSGVWDRWLHQIQALWRAQNDWASAKSQSVISKLIAVNGWRRMRTVDVGYGFHDSQGNTPVLRFWRVRNTVTLEWQTPPPIENERPTWVHSFGQQQFSLSPFLHEVEDFRERLRTEMRGRVREVAALGRLTQTQMAVLKWQGGRAFGRLDLPPRTDWTRVEATVSELESLFGLGVGQLPSG
nr:DUF5984 family protein [Deinococcus aestuarii]